METLKLLRGEDVADRLGVCLSLAYRLMRTGQLASVRFGRTVRVRPEDLEFFILRNLSGDTDPTLLTMHMRKSDIKQ